MTNSEPACLHCGATHQQVPLVRLLAQGKDYFICAQDLPVLIHQPQKLIGKLPGAESLRGHQH